MCGVVFELWYPVQYCLHHDGHSAIYHHYQSQHYTYRIALTFRGSKLSRIPVLGKSREYAVEQAMVRSVKIFVEILILANGIEFVKIATI